MPRISFSTFTLRALKPPAPGPRGQVAQLDYFDDSTPGFALRISSRGNRSWIFMGRVKKRKLCRFTIGRAALKKTDPGLSLAEARAKAKALRDALDRGDDPRRGAGFDAVADRFLEKYAKREQRRWKETERILNRYVRPEWGATPIEEIRRCDVAALLDKIEDENGRTMANRTLAVVRKLFNWYAARDDTFTSPIVRGMARGKPVKRDRALDDDEIRALWAGLEADEFKTGAVPHPFAAITKLLLLTAQRRDEVAKMKYSETAESDGGAIWTIPRDRYKTLREQIVPLTTAALEALGTQARVEGCEHVFTTDGESPFQGFGKLKAVLDDKMAEALGRDLDPWQLRDLRRTARSLMSRAGVRGDIAERVLGHVIAGVEGVYDRHDYLAEKRKALDLLAGVIEEILRAKKIAAAA